MFSKEEIEGIIKDIQCASLVLSIRQSAVLGQCAGGHWVALVVCSVARIGVRSLFHMVAAFTLCLCYTLCHVSGTLPRHCQLMLHFHTVSVLHFYTVLVLIVFALWWCYTYIFCMCHTSILCWCYTSKLCKCYTFIVCQCYTFMLCTIIVNNLISHVQRKTHSRASGAFNYIVKDD